MKKKYFSLVLFIFASLYFSQVTFFAKGEEKAIGNSSAKNVKTITATVSDFQMTKDFSGFVSGVRQADVSPKAGGYVIKLLKEEGDTVQIGEAIAILDGSELSAMDQSALMSLNAIQKTLKDTKDFYDQKVDEAQAALEKTKSEHSSGNASSQDVKLAKEAVESAKRMRDLENAGSQANMAAAQGGELVAHIAAKNAIVTAPFSGTIIKKYASVGLFIAPGTPLYAIASPDNVEIAISLPGSISENLSKGESVLVGPGGQPGKAVSGYVFSVAQAVGASTQQSVARIRFADGESDQALFIGQYVSVTVPVANQRAVILIPEKAILREYDNIFVFVLKNNGMVQKTKITIGESSGDLREVLSGITAGERIVSEGQYALQDGDVVVEK